eukprot:352865-Chlamydomonas_euryale.AAC.3
MRAPEALRLTPFESQFLRSNLGRQLFEAEGCRQAGALRTPSLARLPHRATVFICLHSAASRGPHITRPSFPPRAATAA